MLNKMKHEHLRADADEISLIPLHFPEDAHAHDLGEHLRGLSIFAAERLPWELPT